MIKKISLFALFFLFCFAPAPFAPARPQQSVMPINKRAGEYFNIAEQVLAHNEYKYKIFIAVPKAPAPPGGHPVLYMLDGNALFPVAVNSYNPASGQAPLIVGIGYDGDAAYFIRKRTRDYTVPAKGEGFKNGGGAEEFYQFIQNTVRPLIDSTYNTSRMRQTFMGHSFGGLFTSMFCSTTPSRFSVMLRPAPPFGGVTAELFPSGKSFWRPCRSL